MESDIDFGTRDCHRSQRREILYRRVEFLKRRISERGEDAGELQYDKAELSALRWILDAENNLRKENQSFLQVYLEEKRI